MAPLTRSKTGCATCRQRHQKCDERRPVCSNCVAGSRPCIYPPPPIPLRERKRMAKSGIPPGQHAPWHAARDNLNRAVTAVTPIYGPLGAPLDPFESLALAMPLKSMDLLHYFVKCGEYLAPFSPKYIIGTVGHNSNALRNTLLIASLHYSWSSGSMQRFNPTFLSHKVESLMVLNSWMRDVCTREVSFKIIQSITTHCIAEASLGNFVTAQVHLKGLMRYISSVPLEVYKPILIEEELTIRYTLIILIFVNGLLSRVNDVQHIHSPHLNLEDSATIYSAIRGGHKREQGGLEKRLKALLMMPYFFSADLPGISLGLIDARELVDKLSDFTMKSEVRLFPPASGVPDEFWTEGTATTIFLLLFETHMTSIQSESSRNPLASRERSPLKSAWSPLVAAASLYMGCILALWDLDAARDPNMQKFLIRLIREDVCKTKTWVCEWDEPHRQLWFWKVFIAAMTFAVRPTGEDEDDLELLHVEMNEYIWYWSNMTGITAWKDARAALNSVSWPKYLYVEDEARNLWTDAIS